MSVYVDISINALPIGHVQIRRASDLRATPDDDSVNLYEVTHTTDRTRRRLVVNHRYGDGAMVLVTKAMMALAPVDTEVTTG